MARTKNVEKILDSRRRKRLSNDAPGTYSLIVRVDEPVSIEVGALGEMHFDKGYYVYTGSAMNGVETRIKQHRKDRKHLHYHIDYLLQHGRITNVLVHKSGRRMECYVNRKVLGMKRAEPVQGFGSTDCSRCPCHLARFKNNPIKKIRKLYSRLK